MLSKVLTMTLCRDRCLRVACVLSIAVVCARAESTDVAGTMPEDYLPPLKTILAAAMKQSPQIIAKEMEIALNEARVYGADAQRWPSLGGNLNYQTNTTAVASNQDSQSRDSGLVYNLAFNQAIFHWGQIKNEGEKARIGVMISERNLAEAYRMLALTLRRDYLALIGQKIGVRNAAYQRDLAEAAYKFAMDKRQAGTASEGEVYTWQFNLDDARLQADRMEAQFVSMRRVFAHAAGIGSIAAEAIPDEIPAPAYADAVAKELLAAQLRDGGKSTLQAQIDEMAVRQADLLYRIARVRLLPMFNASAGYSLQNTTTVGAGSVSQTGTTQENVGIGGSWAIFDGWATRGAKREAQASKRLAELNLQAHSEATLDQAQTLERQVALDAQAMAYSERRHGGAVAIVERAKDEAKRGNVSESYIATAKGDLYINDYTNALARATFLNDWSSFVSLAGTDPVLNNLPPRYVREKR